MPLLSEYFTEDQLAAALGRAKRTLRKWKELRIGPPRTVVGQLVLYKKESVLKWLAEREERNAR